MSKDKIRELYESGELTWGDLLEITGLHSSDLFEILYDLINRDHQHYSSVLSRNIARG